MYPFVLLRNHSPWIPSQVSPPLSVKSLLSAYHHVDVSSLHDSQPAGVLWDTVTGPSFSPMSLCRRGRKQHQWRGRQVALRAPPHGTRIHFEPNAIFWIYRVVFNTWALSKCLEIYKRDCFACVQKINGLHVHKHIHTGENDSVWQHTQGERENHHKLQPGVTPQVKSLLRNLRSTVKVATMRLQGPHTHYLYPLSPSFISFPPPCHFFPRALKAFLPLSNQMTNTFKVLQCDHKDTLFSVSPPLALSLSLSLSTLFPLSQGK